MDFSRRCDNSSLTHPKLRCEGAGFHRMWLMNIVIPSMELKARVRCLTCIRGFVWWWHGRSCSSARGPWNSKRKCAALDRPPCQHSGANSRLNALGWFCCSQVLSWWILLLENKEIKGFLFFKEDLQTWNSNQIDLSKSDKYQPSPLGHWRWKTCRITYLKSDPEVFG